MSVESFVIVPLERFSQMENELNRPHEQNSEKQAAEEEQKEQPPEEEPEPDQHAQTVEEPVEEEGGPTKRGKLSEEVVSLAQSQKVKEKLVESFILTLQKYDNNVGVDISNLKALVNAALGTSHRILDNEEKFYDFLLRHSLMDFVTNPHKINRYWPNWYKI